MNKPRSDSLLSQLPDEQQTQIYDWLVTLGYTETLKKIAQPPPDGFDLKTHRSCLHRFFKRYQQKACAEDLVAAKENRFNPEDQSVLVSDAEHSFVHAAHQVATGPMNSSDFSKVGRWLESLKDEKFKRFYAHLAEQNAAIAQKKTTLAENRLELDRQKFQFNAARQALIHFAELAVIARSNDKDNEDKIRAVADLLFQPAPERAGVKSTPSPLINTPLQRGGHDSSEAPAASAASEDTKSEI